MSNKDPLPNKLISPEEAKEQNLKYYFTGIACKNGHVDKRYLNTGICYGCKREINKRDKKAHPKRHKKYSRKMYRKYREKKLETGRLWVKKNREKSNGYKKSYKIRHREKYLKQERLREKRKRKDPLYRASNAIGKQIWAFLKGKKGGRKWESFVGYTFDDLKLHLESLFTREMSWDNYGSLWEIDHKTPKSWFESTEEAVKEAWALDNLQPLLISENRSKANRFKS